MEKLKLKEGDVCKVIANVSRHEFAIGEEVIITELFTDRASPHYRCESKKAIWFLCYEELELIK